MHIRPQVCCRCCIAGHVHFHYRSALSTRWRQSVLFPCGRFPSECSRLTKLTQLDISFNSQLDLEEVSRLLRPLTGLSALCLNHLDLETFPEPVLSLTGLTCLEMGRNRMRSIPQGISSLTNLQVQGVNMSVWMLPQIPPHNQVLRYASSCQVLNLQGAYSCRHGTDLANIAPSIYALTSLRSLNMGCNFTGRFPPGTSRGRFNLQPSAPEILRSCDITQIL